MNLLILVLIYGVINMINFVREYGITTVDYKYLIHNLRMDIMESIELNEDNIREVLKFYNDLGITTGLVNLFIYRPDLIVNTKANIEDIINKVDKDTFINLVNNSVEDLIVIGI